MEKSSIKNYFLYFTLFVSGGVILIIEIAGTRILAPFFGSTIFVWSSLITTTLGFLALGYFLGGVLADKYPKAYCFYFAIFLGGGAALLLIKLNQHLLVFSDKFGFKFGPLVSSALLFALPLLLLSMAGPFAIRLLSREREHSGHVSGMVFGISTVGSLAGALIAGFYLVPNFSLSNVFVFSVAAIMFISGSGLILEKAPRWMIALAIVLFALFLAIPFLKYGQAKEGVSIIEKDQSFYSDLKVVELPYIKTVLMDGAPQSVFGKIKGEVFAQETEQIRRLLEESYEPDAKVLVLGFGVGTAADIFPKELQIDYIELDPKMIELAEEHFAFSLDGNDRIIISDARSFLRKTEKKYDLIFADLYHASAIPLHTHTKEALELAKERLNPEGIFLSNLVAGPKSELAASVIKTMKQVFPKVLTSARLGEEEKEVTNILAYGILDENFEPYFKFRHKKFEIDDSAGSVITDDKNPMETLSLERFGEFRKSAISVFGYQPLFAI